MNIQNIKNETIHKLNRDEIGELGLLNHGVWTYKGQLKSRRKGIKTVKVNDWQINFEGTVRTVEFIKIEQTLSETEWAMRVWEKNIYGGNAGEGKYIEWVSPLLGCDFFK